MQRFYLHTFFAFATWTTLSLTLHYFSASPWGGPLVLDPDRMLPDAIFIEVGLLLFFCLGFGLVERLMLSKTRSSQAWRIAVLLLLTAYCVFGQLDREAVRWLGQHLTLSFLSNYAGAANDALTWKMFSDDLLWTTIAGILIFSTPLPAWYAWAKSTEQAPDIGPRILLTAIILAGLLLSAHRWFRPSEKRWHRIRPASISIVHDMYRGIRKLDRPRDPAQAYNDLAYLLNHTLDFDEEIHQQNSAYPLWRDDNLGSLSRKEFKALPLEERPDIVFIIFETWRGWNSGLATSDSYAVGNPELNALLKNDALIFPYTHSVGFPSVEGLIGLHLGIWSHPFNIFTTDYLHIHSRAFPEVLREFGYSTYALMGADPSFSNFTPWLHRWYDQHEFDRRASTDETLVERFMERYEQHRNDTPRLMTMWTATTHPPYHLPTVENVEPAPDIEGRYVQSLNYADRHLARLLRFLKAQPDWDRTIVVIVGDHSQPTPDQWRFMDAIGGLSAGHTWTSLAITGGWDGLPKPGQWNFDVSHVDIAPTLLSMLNIRTGNHFIGENLISRIREYPPQEVAPTDEDQRMIAMLRYGDVAFQSDDERFVFNLLGDTLFRFNFDRSNAEQYGQLRYDLLDFETVSNEAYPVERWRDAIRAYGALLDDDRLMPPTKAP